MEFRFSVLGRTRVRIGDRFDDRWGHAKVRGVLAVLLLHPRQSLSFDTITEWVWPLGEGPAQRGTFHKYGDRVRKALNQMEPPPELRCRDGTYRLDVEHEEVDYFQFRAAIARGREAGDAGDHIAAYQTLEHALRLWTDQPFADLHGELARYRRLQADLDLWLPAYDVLLRELFALERFDEMLRRLDDLPVEHQRHLALASHRFKALYALNRHKEAITYVHRARKHLRNNDQFDEADELLRLHDELRQYDSSAPTTPIRRAEVDQRAPAPQMLPRDIHEFVGRSDQLNELDSSTTTRSGEPVSAVVIVDGPPGVGKTALVVHWAHRVLHRYPGGVLFIDLNGYSDRAQREREPTSVVDDCLAALNAIPDRSLNDRGKELLLNRLLARRHTLVVLDNARDVEHIRDLVSILTSCTVVITSRRRMRALATMVSGRWVTVEPMNNGDAAKLLSTQLGGHRVLNDDDCARLVRHCGGLAIAITVLTGHLASNPAVPVAEFARGLTTRQLVDDLGDDTANVGSLFAQSYRSLAEPERRLLRLLSVHPGPDISLDAASAVDGRTRHETTRSLAVLVGAHLVEQHAFGRFRLHDLLAEFAARRLETDERLHLRDEARQRLVRYYLDSATNAAQAAYPSHLASPVLDDGLDVLSTSFATNSDAHDWFHRERANLMAVIAAAEHGLPGYLWRLADPVTTFCDRYGCYADSRAIRQLALTATRADGNREGEISALLGLGIVNMKLGDHLPAQHHLDNALQLATEDGLMRGQAAALHQLGRLEAMRGNPAAALDLFRRGLRIADRDDDQEGRCWYLYRIGAALRLLEQFDEALVNLLDARMLAQKISQESAHAAILTEIGTLYCERGEYATANAHLQHARQVAEAIPDLTATERARVALAELCHAQRQTDTALQHIQQAVDICEQTLNRFDEARALTVLGTIHHARGDRQHALAAWRRAADRYHRSGNSEIATRLEVKIDSVSRSSTSSVPAARTEPVSTRHVHNEHTQYG